METKKFDEALNKIFNITEAVLQPEVTGLVPPEGDSVEVFRNLVKERLRGLKKSPEGTPHTQRGPGAPGEAIMEQPKQVDVPYPDPKVVTQAVGSHKSTEELLNKLAELLGVSRQDLTLSPNPFPTGEIGVWLKVHESNKGPETYLTGKPNTSSHSQNIGDIWTTPNGFIFKNHSNPYFANKFKAVKETNVQVDKGLPGMAVVEARPPVRPEDYPSKDSINRLVHSKPVSTSSPAKTGFKSLVPKVRTPEERLKGEIAYGPNGEVVRGGLKERENPISVGTIKSQVQNFGPEALGQIVAKLSPDMDKVDANGQPTSEYNQFVESIKQDGLEIILNASSAAGGVKTAPNGQANAKPASPAPGAEAPEEPGQELASL